jgi:hypothetical protein
MILQWKLFILFFSLPHFSTINSYNYAKYVPHLHYSPKHYEWLYAKSCWRKQKIYKCPLLPNERNMDKVALA